MSLAILKDVNEPLELDEMASYHGLSFSQRPAEVLATCDMHELGWQTSLVDCLEVGDCYDPFFASSHYQLWKEYAFPYVGIEQILKY